MALTERPKVLQPAFNEVVVCDSTETTLAVSSVAPSPAAAVTLNHVIKDGAARFDLKGFLSKLFVNTRSTIPTTLLSPWAYLDQNLVVNYSFGDSIGRMALNAVQQLGETVDLMSEVKSPVLTRRCQSMDHSPVIIPAYEGYPVGVSLMYRNYYGDSPIPPDPPTGDPMIVGIHVGDEDPTALSVTFPFLAADGRIDYGDGVIEATSDSMYRTHVYETPGLKTVKFYINSGTGTAAVTPENHATVGTYCGALGEVRTLIPQIIDVKFYMCWKLNTIDMPLQYAHDQNAGFQCFAGCTSLTVLRYDFFHILRNSVHDFINFDQCFSGAGLVDAPTRLFEGFKDRIRRLHLTFAGCIDLPTIMPGMLSDMPNLEDMNSTFQNCGLTTLPDDLLANNTKLNLFVYVFQNCKLTAIPNNLFATTPNITFFAGAFDGNSTLRGATPSGDGRKLWQRQGAAGYPVQVEGPTCFRGCTGLSDYSSIPISWR